MEVENKQKKYKQKMKNDFYLEAAALSEVKPKNLKSVKNSVSWHIDQCFGYFSLEQSVFL